jgi:hypothetical protein
LCGFFARSVTFPSRSGSRGVSDRLELSEKPIEMSMQVRPVHGPDYADHQVNRRQFILFFSESVPDDPFDPVSRAGSGHRLLADDQAQSSVVHSIENQVQT